MFFICSQDGLRFLRVICHLIGLFQWEVLESVKVTYFCALVTSAPRVPWGRKFGTSWPYWPETVLKLSGWASWFGHEPEIMVHISLKSPGYVLVFCTRPFSLVAFSENVILRKERPSLSLFCFTGVKAYKSEKFTSLLKLYQFTNPT